MIANSPSPRLDVAAELRSFVDEEVLSGLPISSASFWAGLTDILVELAPRNRDLLVERERLQGLIDQRNATQNGRAPSSTDEEAFLRSIGYLAPAPDPFTISTENVDEELALLCGPQLVVPVDNARYALNAANARWGSLYDALYGTDALTEALPRNAAYDPARGAQVISWCRSHLDAIFPLASGKHADVRRYFVEEGTLATDLGRLASPAAFVGYRGPPQSPDAILLNRHGLHVELIFDRAHPVGSTDRVGMADIQLESAISAIMDFEDAVAAVDATDKIAVYRNWLGLMRGDLEAKFYRRGVEVTRRLADDRAYMGGDGAQFSLKGRALMLVRNVGHLMTTPMVLLNGEEAPEGIIDAAITALIGRHDTERRRANSRTGSIYVVKPKMHGPQEAAFSQTLFERVEALAGLPRNTMKIGIMDEERRTTLNLAAVIEALKERVVFVNTGFLDRTGDEIHTAMKLGPVLRKTDMKSAAWLSAYEDQNVDVGLACGFLGRAQIGKGMWAMPDRMADMLQQKIAHPMAGASTAWVPSPTAATLHAIHYHLIDVRDRQMGLMGRAPRLANLLKAPIASRAHWTEAEIAEELDSNVQSILGYVVRWVDQGIGCSKVPDIHDIGLMEDRATCRISSQILANWLEWGVFDEARLFESMRRMAKTVDEQNAGDPAYLPMMPNCHDSVAFQAARTLILEGTSLPSGYTEPVLHEARVRRKALST